MSLFHDLRFALRQIPRHAGFTCLAVVTLALGIGASTTLYSVLHGVVLSPLPFPEPELLVAVGEQRDDGKPRGISPPEFLDWQEHNDAFTALAAYSDTALTLTGEGEAVMLHAVRASATLLPVLGVEPMLGRGFSTEEDRHDAVPVALLTHAFWQRRFAGEDDVLGRQLRLDGRLTTVVGVLPPELEFPLAEAEVWLPMAFEEDLLEERGYHFAAAVGRLAPGVDPAAAEAELETISARGAAEAGEDEAHGAWVAPLKESLVGEMRPALLALLGAALLVLLIACVNVANLILVRTAGRRRELSVRAALGASQGRLAWQLLTESVLLGILGGGAGILLATWGVQLALLLSPDELPRSAEIAIDGPVLLFAFGLAFLTSLGFGLAPALLSRDTLESPLRDASRGNTGRHVGRGVLIAAQLALALVLLLGAGLLLRSFAALIDVDPGFRGERLLTGLVSLPDDSYPDPEDQLAYADRLLARLEAEPGARRAALIAPLPLSGNQFTLRVDVAGYEPGPGEVTSTPWRAVSPNYLETVGVPLLEGRHFTAHDNTFDARPVIIVNQSMARHFWPGESALGKMVIVGYNDIDCEVVGVVGDVRHRSLESAGGNEFYTPFGRTPWSWFYTVVETEGDPRAFAGQLSSAIAEVDPEVAVLEVKSMEEYLSLSLAERRFHLALLAIFALLALTLAGIGIYGVTSYSVSERKREFGIRISLGAQPRDVMRAVLGGGLRVVLAGAGAGVAVALALGRLASGMLYGVDAADPWTFAGGVAILVALAFLAMALPARRATRVDPVTVLRDD